MNQQKIILYPRIPHDKMKSVKIKLDDQIKMKHLIEIEYLSIKQVAELYNVSPDCVRYNIDPIFRRNCLDKNSARKRECYRTDPKFRENLKKRKKQLVNNRIESDSEFANYIKIAKKLRSSSENGKKIHRISQKKYRDRNRIKLNNEEKRISRVKNDSFFRLFWNIIEPDNRTQREKVNANARMWRKNNPEKARTIDIRRNKKCKKARQKTMVVSN